HPKLNAARPADGRAAEERTLEQIRLVEEVLDVDLWPHDRITSHPRVAGAQIGDRARAHLDALVEVEQPRAVRTVAVGRIDAVGETAAVDLCRTQEESVRRVGHAGDGRQPLIVVEVEEALRFVGREEATRNRPAAIRMVECDVYVPG